MSGPPPNPNARRTNNKGDWRTVPAVCTRPVPAWPLKGRARPGQAELWRHLWSLPAAEIWHEQNAVRLVARYTRLVLDAETITVDTKLAAEARQIEDRLLLSPKFLLGARVLIAEPATGPTPSGVTNLDDYRDLDVG